MSWHRIEGNWNRFTGNVKKQWGKPSDDRLDRVAGKRDEPVGTSPETSGVKQGEAGEQVKPVEERHKD